MLLSKNKLLSWCLGALSVVLFTMILLPVKHSTVPALVPPPVIVGQNVSGPSSNPDRQARIQASVSPARMADRFFTQEKRMPVASAATPQPSPLPPPSPAPVEPPLPANDLRYIGTVEVDGQTKLALYDSIRQASFTIAPGETWSEWTCLSNEAGKITLKKNERTYFVPLKK